MMLSERQLKRAIAETEASPDTFDKCLKLYVYNGLLRECYSEAEPPERRTVTEYVIDIDDDDEFALYFNGKDIKKVMPLICELLATIKVRDPKLGSAFLDRLKKI